MRTALYSLCLLLAACSSAPHARSTPSQAETDSAALARFDQAWCDAYRNSDVSWFERNLGDDVLVVLPDGTTRSKTEEIAAIRRGHGPVESFTASDSVFHIDGNLAVETSIAHLVVRGSNGRLVQSDYRSSTAYVRRDGRWMAVLDHVTPIKQARTSS